jgi:hypothetical protein
MRVPEERYAAAPDFRSYVASVQRNADLWDARYRTAVVPEDLAARAGALTRNWHLLVLSEDWCGDAVNTIPVLARLVDMSPRLGLRILARDQNPDLMASHLTSGTRSIPVVMVLDEDFHEHGWWGPRPAALQGWVRGEGLLLPKDERYRRARRWYARDRGRTTIEEVLILIERADALTT